MITVRSIITEALNRSNLVSRRQTPPADMVESAYRLLKGIAGEFSNDNLLQFLIASVETTFDKREYVLGESEEGVEEYLPVDIDQEVRFFKGIGTVNPSGEIVITTQLDLEAMEFADTSKEVCEKLSSAKGDVPTITLSSAKPGFWYAVAVADNLADLQTAGVADAARASGNGVSLTIPKPEGGTAFFKVMVNTQEIPVR